MHLETAVTHRRELDPDRWVAIDDVCLSRLVVELVQVVDVEDVLVEQVEQLDELGRGKEQVVLQILRAQVVGAELIVFELLADGHRTLQKRDDVEGVVGEHRLAVRKRELRAVRVSFLLVDGIEKRGQVLDDVACGGTGDPELGRPALRVMCEQHAQVDRAEMLGLGALALARARRPSVLDGLEKLGDAIGRLGVAVEVVA